MYVSKKSIIKTLTLIAVTIIACLMVKVSESLYIHMAAMILVCFTAIVEVKGNLMHPYVWFSAFFGLYSIGYPWTLAMGFTSRVGYSKETMLYQLLALITVLIAIGPKCIKEDDKWIKDYDISLGVLNKIIYIVLVMLIVVGALYVSRSGFSGKDDIYNSGNTLLIMIFRLPLILTLLYALSVTTTYYREGKFPVKQAIITFIALLLITLFSGERDFVFRFVLVNIFILWFLRKIRIKHLIVMIPIIIVLIPLSSSYKYYFLTGSASVTNNNIIYAFLSGEFESATRNLQALINNSSSTLGVKGLGQIVRDVVAVFNSSIESSTSWFNNTFYPTSKTQYGFTLVGEGYIIAGALGVVLVFAIIGIIIRIMYKKAYNNMYLLIAYIYFITVMIYSIRGDLSTVFSALIKQIFLVLFIIFILEKISKSRQR